MILSTLRLGGNWGVIVMGREVIQIWASCVFNGPDCGPLGL